MLIRIINSDYTILLVTWTVTEYNKWNVGCYYYEIK